MKQKVFLGALLTTLVLPMMVGCNSRPNNNNNNEVPEYTDNSETLNKTSYKGIAGDIYNGFLGLFKSFSLSYQVKKLIEALV